MIEIIKFKTGNNQYIFVTISTLFEWIVEYFIGA